MSGATRICAFSDPHGMLPGPDQFPDADLYLLGGDVCPISDHSPEWQWGWMQDELAPWLAALERRAPVVWVAGNHDFALADRFGTGVVAAPDELAATYLQDAATVAAGRKIWGSPHSVYLPYWAFMWPDAREEGQAGFSLEEAWGRVDASADVLLVHGPPHGYGDLLTDGETHVGSRTLTTFLGDHGRHRARVLVCGHIHEAYGHWRLPSGDPDVGCLIVNASLVDERYRMVNEPVLISLPDSGPAAVLEPESEIGGLGLRAEW